MAVFTARLTESILAPPSEDSRRNKRRSTGPSLSRACAVKNSVILLSIRSGMAGSHQQLITQLSSRCIDSLEPKFCLQKIPVRLKHVWGVIETHCDTRRHLKTHVSLRLPVGSLRASLGCRAGLRRWKANIFIVHKRVFYQLSSTSF